MLSCVATAVKFAARPEEPPEPGRNLARKTKKEEQDEDGDGDEDEERWLGGSTIIMQLQPEVLFIDGSPHKDLGLGLGLNFGFGLAMQTTFTSAT